MHVEGDACEDHEQAVELSAARKAKHLAAHSMSRMGNGKVGVRGLQPRAICQSDGYRR
jgi:hypothetical protein